MKDNISNFFNRLLLNFMGFFTFLIASLLLPFILISDLIKYIFLDRQVKKKHRSVFSLSIMEFIIEIGILILFFVFCYFDRKSWYLFYVLPIPLGLLETLREIIFNKRETILSIIMDDTLCGTPFLQREEKSHLEETPIQDDSERLSYEESKKLFEDMMGL